MLSLHVDLKIILNLQNAKFLSIVRLSLVLKSSEALPKYGKTQIISLLGNVTLKCVWTNSLFKNLFEAMIHEMMGITIVF